MTECSAETIVPEQVPELDGCPILAKVKAYVVPAGAMRVLEHVFRNSQQQPLDLSACGSVETGNSLSISASLSISESAGTEPPGGHIWVRVREYLSLALPPTGRSPLYEFEAYSPEPTTGLVRAPLPAQLMNTPGVYLVNWALKDHAGNILTVDDSTLLVERSLWMTQAPNNRFGPPTFNEIRLSLRDFPQQNLLLQDYEFDGAEIMQAITRPIAQWNQTPPPVGTYTTHNFPFTEPWLAAIQGELMFMAAHLFRRNNLPYSAGGLSINDQGKEKEYLAAAQLLADRYRLWVTRIKVAINAQASIGSVSSPYAGYYGWNC